MMNGGVQSDASDTAEMKANAQLRESYLRLMSNLGGKEVELRMYGKTDLKGDFVAIQQNNEHIFVDNLNTPTGPVKHAALRTRDVISIKVPVESLK